MRFINLIKQNTYRWRRNLLKDLLSIFYWRDKIIYFIRFKKALPEEMPWFIIAGLPKCGTVWLVEALKKYPQFNYVENPFYKHKHEIRFFSLNFDKPIKKYLETFKQLDLGKLNFEKSPDYSVMSKMKIKLIKKLNPTIKIILIFRDPVERTFSNAKMDLIRKKNISLIPENDSAFYKHYDSQFERYNYEKILKKWYCVFPKDQILVLSLEDIKLKPQNVLKRVFCFFNIDDDFKKYRMDVAKNETQAKPIPEAHRAYIERKIPDTIKFWNNNKRIFRLEQ